MVYMVHILEEIHDRTPANPNKAAPEAVMPQAVWEALLRDAVQGLRPPYTRQTFRQWHQTTHPQALAIGAPKIPTPPHHHHTGKGKGTGKGRLRDGNEHPGKGAGKGRR